MEKQLTINELISKAKAVIGKPTEDSKNLFIDPTTHAQQYQESAPALAAVLNSSKIMAATKMFDRWNQEAIGAQALFNKIARRSNLAVFFTACLGATVLVVNGSGLPAGFQLYRDTTLVVLGVFAVVVDGLGSMWLYQIQAGKLLESWMSQRANAEAERLRLFELI